MNCGVDSFGSTYHQLIIISYVCLSCLLGLVATPLILFLGNVQARRVVTWDGCTVLKYGAFLL